MPEATRRVCDYLKKRSDKGFFLMVEGSQIDWGGLPAPWEALPDGIFSTSEAEPDDAESPKSERHTATRAGREPQGNEVMPGWENDSIPAQSETESAFIHESPVSPPAMLNVPPSMLPGMSQVAPDESAPDLDALARQVYEVLKRRLAAERRRQAY